MVHGVQPVRSFTITRAGNLDPNVRVVEQRAQSFTASAAVKKGASLIVTRDASGLRSHVVVPDVSGVDKQALSLAQAVAGRLEPSDETPDLSEARVVGHLTYVKTDASTHLTQSGLELAETSRQLSNVLPEGAWVGLSIRSARRTETKRWAKWLAFRMSTPRPVHHSMSTHSVIASIWAGGETRHEVEQILDAVRANLPGFDLDAKTIVESRLKATAAPIAVGLALLVATMLGYLPIPTVAGIGAGIVGLLLGLGAYRGYVPTADSRVRAAVARGTLPAVRQRTSPPTPPRKESTNREGVVTHARDGDYPLHPSAFKIGPSLVAALVAPHAGAASGVQSTATRATPPKMTERIGPLLGSADDGQMVYLSANPADATVSIIGAAGSGKSALTRHLTAWYILERTRPSGLAGFPGANNALVVFDPKPDGARYTGAWAKSLGDKVRLVEVASPNGFAIDLFGTPGSIKDKAKHVVSAMRYAFGEKSIQTESSRSLTWVLTAGQAVDDEVASSAGLPTGRSAMFYAYVLLGSHGDEKAQRLAKSIESCLSLAKTRMMTAGRRLDTEKASALTERHDRLALAHEELSTMFGPKVTAATRLAFQRAPGNKVYALLELEHWWSPERKKFTWDQVIKDHRAVVIMTGTTASGHHMELESERAMASMLMFSLKKSIERNCAGWAEQNRWVTVVSDELSDLAGENPEVIVWLRDRGRSYGVRVVFATQRPRQLPDEVRESFMSFSTLVAFKQDYAPVASEIASDFSADGSEWAAADVLNLPEHHAIVRSNVDFKRQPPFVLKPLYREGSADNMREFVYEQGY